MRDLKSASLMLALARRDARTAQRMLAPGEFVDEVFGFHAQQAVEKALKAWIACEGLTYPTSHDLMALYEILLDHGAERVRVYEHLTDLTVFAVQFRYAFFDDDPVDRGAISGAVSRRIEEVEDIIKAAESAQ